MNESFREITIHPALPCVYHGCDGQATVAIVYEVSEREWRMVPTCERHTVPVTGHKARASIVSQREEAV
jgi:hypothetical protein